MTRRKPDRLVKGITFTGLGVTSNIKGQSFEAIAAGNTFVALPESEKTLDEAKRVTAMMDEAGKSIAESSEALHNDLQSSISNNQERREILKEELEEVNAGVLHLARRSDGALHFRDYISKAEDDQNEGNSDEVVVLTNEVPFKDVEVWGATSPSKGTLWLWREEIQDSSYFSH
ncbi:hypothetical protein IW261DRAFT_1418362 [Armillaria novae-zelandiae]|uniref:Uncharacterized protein n=1 Tax=Armillaria novae-zelandiae TaxID=153914 RepID=A0AA39PCB9_9AGAR|nr:hypothetical protein IW261DRAFT_1418362 [Armillaria novae-zelandiae]